MNAVLKQVKRSLAVLAIMPFVLQATPIPADVSVTGIVEFAVGLQGSVPFEGDGAQSGTMSSTLGGITDTSVVNDIGVSGSSPQGGAFSMLGDGVEVTTAVDGRAGSRADDFIFDLSFLLENNSLTDTFRFLFELTFDNNTSAFGTDAFVDSEINVLDSSLTELFASDLTTDTFFGDSNTNGPTGTSGETLNESGSELFEFDLAAGLSDTFSAVVKVDGREFNDDGGFNSDSTATFRLVSVTNLSTPAPIPAPATLPLLLLGLWILRKKR